ADQGGPGRFEPDQDQFRGPRGRAGVLGLRLDHDPQRNLLQVPQLRQHVGLQLDIKEEETAVVSSTRSSTIIQSHPSWSHEGPECPCGGPTDWDGRKFRCRGCGLYYETCCDGGRCP